MTDQMTTMPTRVAAWLVAGHVDNLWDAWANDKDAPGCCPKCCGPCAALKELYDRDQLDALYGAYVDRVGGEMDTWDATKRQVGREWLLEAWSFNDGCHDDAPHPDLAAEDAAIAVRDAECWKFGCTLHPDDQPASDR